MQNRRRTYKLTVVPTSLMCCSLRVVSIPLNSPCSLAHRSVITAHCQRETLSPFTHSSSMMKNRCLPMCEILASGNFYAHGRILPPIRGVALHIPQTWTPRREKRKSAWWGIVQAPTGASPRNPQLTHSSLVTLFNPLQNRDFCRTGPLKSAKICCKPNF